MLALKSPFVTKGLEYTETMVKNRILNKLYFERDIATLFILVA